MSRAQHLRRPGQLVVQEYTAATHQHYGHVTAAQLDPVYRRLHPAPDCRHRRISQRTLYLRHQGRVAYFGPAVGDGQIGSSQSVAAEHQRLLRQTVSNAFRADTQPFALSLAQPLVLSLSKDDAAASQWYGHHVGHTEVGADTGKLYRNRRLPWESLDQRANIGRGAADVHHDAVAHSRQPGRSPHTVGRAGGDGEDRESGSELSIHQRPVVLAHEKRRADAQGFQGFPDTPYGEGSHVSQAGVEGCRILPFQQSHAPVLVGHAQPHIRCLLADNGGGLGLMDRVHQREHTGERHGSHTLIPQIPDCASQLLPVQRRNLPPIELMPSAHHVGQTTYGVLQL